MSRLAWNLKVAAYRLQQRIAHLFGGHVWAIDRPDLCGWCGQHR